MWVLGIQASLQSLVELMEATTAIIFLCMEQKKMSVINSREQPAEEDGSKNQSFKTKNQTI